MPRDHYISQAYLRSFSIPGNVGYVNIIRKSDLKKLDSIPINTICCPNHWSTNNYYPANPRIVEDYLEHFEPEWLNCIEKIETGNFNNQLKSTIAGYLAFLRVYTPTAARLGQNQLAEIIKQTATLIEQKELLNPNSKYKDAIEKIREAGGITVDVDRDFAKALGISNLDKMRQKLIGYPWLILINKSATAFITSDNPVCLKYWEGNPYCDFYCPLTPRTALFIHPTHNEVKESDDMRLIKDDKIGELNSLVVKCAEENVIFNEVPGIEALVREYQKWRMEMVTTSFHNESDVIILTQQRPVDCRKGK
ncbi:MAG: DUF4238 domain-containing protein [candidate division FCPU426 bacterium]